MQKSSPTVSHATLLLILRDPQLINPNLVGGRVFLLWFSLNNLETVKTVTLAFCSIRSHFIRDICAKFGIPNWPQSLDIGQNLDVCISNFRISGQSLIKENCLNSRTSDDIVMKLRLVTKLDKRNKKPSKNLTMTSCQKIMTSLSFFLFMTDLEQSVIGFRMHSLQNLYFHLQQPFYITKSENRTKISHNNTSLTLLL